VFDNLFGNVRAHTPPGTTATITISRLDGEAVCRVSDNGPGVTAEDAARLFERFFRADPSRSRTSGGSGLGLSIVAAIVAAHGGRVEAAPGEQGGAIFTIRLPLQT
jgi:two-component system OmpR family sensor kinase